MVTFSYAPSNSYDSTYGLKMTASSSTAGLQTASYLSGIKANDSVLVSCKPAAGFVFDNFTVVGHPATDIYSVADLTNLDSDTSTYELLLSGGFTKDVTVTANFDPVLTYTIQTQAGGDTGGSGGQTAAASNGSGGFGTAATTVSGLTQGTLVKLVAAVASNASNNYVFSGWTFNTVVQVVQSNGITPDDASKANATCYILMPAGNVVATANYSLKTGAGL
jgi:hypothetical protein